jgi:hypothetical protein
MNRVEAITCQIRAVADHVLDADYSGAELRLVAVELRDTLALVEVEINRKDDVAKGGKRALRQLMTDGDDAA